MRTRLSAIAVVADAFGLSFPRPFATPITRRELELNGVTGDLYAPERPAPAIVLVPGAAERGKDDPRVIRVAQALARARRVVFVPQLELARRRLDTDDLERLVESAQAIARSEETMGRPSLLGFSYGGSFALIAAADPRLDQVLEQVAVFGAYFDIVGVLQALTSGVSVVDGRAVPWEAHPRARQVLAEVALRLVAPEARAQLQGALEGGLDPASLPEEARVYYDLLNNEDPQRTFSLADRLPHRERELLRRFSPSSVAARLRVPVIALHSTDDPIVPYGELLRLSRQLPHARILSASLFTHVNFAAKAPRTWSGAAADARTVWRFTSWLLAGSSRGRRRRPRT